MKTTTLIGIGNFVRVIRKLSREYPHLDFGGITYKEYDGTEHTGCSDSTGYYIVGSNGIVIRQAYHYGKTSASVVYSSLAKTILHEVAHRMVDNTYGAELAAHGKEFQLQCFELGLNGCKEGYDSVEKFLPPTINKLVYDLDFTFASDGSYEEDRVVFTDVIPEGEPIPTDEMTTYLQDDKYAYGVPSELWNYDDREPHWSKTFYAEKFCREIGWWFSKRVK